VPEEIGFFNLNLSNKFSKDDVVHCSKDTYYRDVYIFVERVSDIATIRGLELVRDNLVTCLQDSALEWYTGQLTALEKRALHYRNDIEEWKEALQNRFKRSPHTALEAMLRKTYTQEDARQQRDPQIYAQAIIQNANAAGLTGHLQQMQTI
jgi:hypothetical protein